MPDEILKQYHKLFNDCWKFIKTHNDITEEKEKWIDLINGGDDIVLKYDSLNRNAVNWMVQSAIVAVQEIYRAREEAG